MSHLVAKRRNVRIPSLMHFLMGGFFFLLQEEQVSYPPGMWDFFSFTVSAFGKKIKSLNSPVYPLTLAVIFIHILTLL